jgi:hypothetical protein
VSEFEGSGETITQHRWPRLLGIGVVVIGLLGHLMGSRWLPRTPPVDSSLLVLIGAVIFLSGRLARVRRRAELHADALGMKVNGTLVAARRNIVRAHRVTGEKATVRVVQKGWSAMDVSLASEEAAQSLLAALGLGTGQALASFGALYGGQTRQKVRAMGLVVVVFGASLVASLLLTRHGFDGPFSGPSFIGGPMLVAAAFLWAALSARVTVDVGSDGLLLRRITRRRFVSFADLRSVASDGQDVVLGLRSGEWLRLGLGTRGASEDSREALIQRIEEARAAFVQGRGTEGAEALVAPGGRALEAWVREARTMGAGGQYRAASLTADRLWRVVDDAGAPAATRAGAAMVLAGDAADADVRQRLRVSAEACADPKLRVALQSVASDHVEEEALLEAMRPLVERAG